MGFRHKEKNSPDYPGSLHLRQICLCILTYDPVPLYFIAPSIQNL